ncbi:MAG: hypothetical protein Q9M27_06975, partial [Mariprofundaceae bacterium]|nr:hypothetical protein [Mariprofundaceae bacterium]
AAYKVFDDVIFWLEPPLPPKDQSYPHIDAVVFLPRLETAIFLEAKRINNPTRKKRELINDACRMLMPKNRQHVTKGASFHIERHIVVLMADVWLETRHKRFIPYWWTSADKHKPAEKSPLKSTFVEEIRKTGHQWNEKDQSVHAIKDEKSESVLDKYRLLFGYHEIVP